MRRVSLSPLTLLAALTLLSACAGHTPPLSSRQQAARYAARTPGDYTPPGPPEDPWGPYISQAAQRFDVPERWIRAVMEVESGGQEYLNGQPITSPAGAMGLMQVMPDTYQALESEYGLGDDPYNPRDNIFAGAAYLREMYDLFGAPGFLAAYNCGPACYEDYISRRSRLPAETRHYVAMLAPQIRGTYPGPGTTQYAMNSPPAPLPPPRPVTAPVPEVRVAELPQPPRPLPPPPVRVAARPPAQPVPQVSPAPQRRPSGGFHLITPAVAETLPPQTSNSQPGHWAVQVGAFDKMATAHDALNVALKQAPGPLRAAWPMVASVREKHGMLYRARLVGLSHESAEQACQQLAHAHTACFLVSPAAQS